MMAPTKIVLPAHSATSKPSPKRVDQEIFYAIPETEPDIIKSSHLEIAKSDIELFYESHM
jgi:hypothetical protein